MSNGETGVFTVPPLTKGWDCNTPISLSAAKLMKAAGYRFAVRYVRRDPVHSYDLSAEEIRILILSGLAVMPVQHVESADSWAPSAAKGQLFGQTAAEECISMGLPKGITVWCDLEGVEVGTSHEDVIAYGKEWYNAVDALGYIPGIYLGWHYGLTASEAYYKLPFKHYWGAFNLDKDREPVVRGLQMKQVAVKKKVKGIPFSYQRDYVRRDKKGGLPTCYGPVNWMDTL